MLCNIPTHVSILSSLNDFINYVMKMYAIHHFEVLIKAYLSKAVEADIAQREGAGIRGPAGKSMVITSYQCFIDNMVEVLMQSNQHSIF